MKKLAVLLSLTASVSVFASDIKMAPGSKLNAYTYDKGEYERSVIECEESEGLPQCIPTRGGDMFFYVYLVRGQKESVVSDRVSTLEQTLPIIQSLRDAKICR